MVPIVELPEPHGQTLVPRLKEPSVVSRTRSHAGQRRSTQRGNVSYGNVTDLWKDGSHAHRLMQSKAQQLLFV